MSNLSPITVGMIGLSNQAGYTMREAVLRLSPVPRVWGYDIRPEAGERFARLYPDTVTVVDSIAAVAEASSLIKLNIPPGADRPRVMRTIIETWNGRPGVIMLEKPIAASLADAERMMQLEAQHPDVRVVVCLDRLPATRWLAEKIAGGAIGVPIEAVLTATFKDAYRNLPHWFFDPAMGGGGVKMDLLAHPVAMFLNMVPSAIDHPSATNLSEHLNEMLGTESPVEDTSYGGFRFKRDAKPGAARTEGVGFFHVSWAGEVNRLSVTVTGTKGRCVCAFPGDDPGPSRARRDEDPVDALSSTVELYRGDSRRPERPTTSGLRPSLIGCRTQQLKAAIDELRALQAGDRAHLTGLPTLQDGMKILKFTLDADRAARAVAALQH